VYAAPGARHGGDPGELLRSSRRPVVLAGIGAARAGAGDDLLDLAATVGAPVVVAPMAKGVVPETDAWFAGVLDMACNDVMWRLLGDGDLIVAVGFDPVELIKPWTLQVPVLHIDAGPNTDQVYRADVEVVGDIGGSLRWLAGEWRGEARWDEAEVAAATPDSPATEGEGGTAAPPPLDAAQMFGLSLGPITEEVRSKYSIGASVEGVVVEKVEQGSEAEEKGVHEGEVIVQVSQTDVSAPEQVIARLEELKAEGRRTAMLLVSGADNQLRFVSLRFEDK